MPKGSNEDSIRHFDLYPFPIRIFEHDLGRLDAKVVVGAYDSHAVVVGQRFSLQKSEDSSVVYLGNKRVVRRLKGDGFVYCVLVLQNPNKEKVILLAAGAMPGSFASGKR